MNVQILKRIAAIENRVQRPSELPSLIMIGYNSTAAEWKITESYEIGRGRKKAFKEKQCTAKHLKDYLFPAEGNPRVIMDTFGNPEPDIYENLFFFDLRELRKDLKAGEAVSIGIEAIREKEDESTMVEIVAYIADR